MEKEKIDLFHGTMKYSNFFGILTLLSFIGGYIHYRFYSLFFAEIFFLIAIVFGSVALYWIWNEKKMIGIKKDN